MSRSLAASEMHGCAPRAIDPWLRRLDRVGGLSEAERLMVARLVGPVEIAPMGRDLVGAGTKPGHAWVLVSGWACRQRLLPDGRRQILDLLLAGDMIGLPPDDAALAASWTVCLTRAELIDAEPLRRFLADTPEQHPAIARAVRALARSVEARLLNHVVRLGRLTAYERVGHLLLELHDRLRDAGLADGQAFPMPLTQETLADALGLSVVHVNRVLQQLRRDRLIDLHAGRASLLEPTLLAKICDFSPMSGGPIT